MSKLLENNKQMIHVASEVVVLLGITYYFSSKNKKLVDQLDDLSQRVEEQEEIIQKHIELFKQQDAMIRQLATMCQQPQQQSQQQQSQQQQSQRLPVNEKSLDHKTRKISKKKEEQLRQEQNKKQEKSKVRFSAPLNDGNVIVENMESDNQSSEEDDSDLDQEIREELDELSDGSKKKD
jgi:hypothetical protein